MIYFQVYLTENLINGKTYIGQHKCESRKRDRYLGSGKILRQAIEKYGKDNFQKYILEACETKEQADFFEKRYIWFHRLGGKAEYNITDGGEQNGMLGRTGELNHRYNKNLSEEHRKNISASWNPNSARRGENHHFYGVKGKAHPLYGVSRPDMSARTGEKHHFYGKKLSEEHRQKLSDAKKGKKYGPRGPYKKRKKD